MKLTIVAGARPNFLKIAPLIKELDKAIDQRSGISYRLVHTGQHYDKNLSEVFFKELGIPKPDANLEVGSGSHAVQTAAIMMKFEQDLLDNPCDIVIVVGDVNSTMACSLVAKKLNIKVAHIEAGIRSGDMTMPEEVNRIVTDSIADYFFTPTETANEHLMRVGVSAKDVFYVGNIMIDSLMQSRQKLTAPSFLSEQNLDVTKCIVLTLHRPSNVDDLEKLRVLMDTVIKNTRGYHVIFPVHPRTKEKLAELKIEHERLVTVPPMNYLSFNYLVSRCMAVVTDSGGIQEETTVMGVPCITLRSNTERPETVTIGTNILVGDDMNLLESSIEKVIAGEWKEGNVPDLWDGKTASRIVDVLLSIKNIEADQQVETSS